MSSSTVNREYKDRLFKFIFGNQEKKNWTLSLYNAVNGSSYPDSDAEKIQIRTLNDVVYMSMKNDISFLIGNTMNFYEVQSSYNPNKISDLCRHGLRQLCEGAGKPDKHLQQ